MQALGVALTTQGPGMLLTSECGLVPRQLLSCDDVQSLCIVSKMYGTC